MEIKPTYASFEQSKWLKEKGFNVECRNYYLEKDKELYEGFEDEYWGDYRCKNWNADVIGIKPFKGFISAPEQWQVVEWLRVNHGIWIYVVGGGNNQYYPMYQDKNQYKLALDIDKFYGTPQEAYSAAFDYIQQNDLI